MRCVFTQIVTDSKMKLDKAILYNKDTVSLQIEFIENYNNHISRLTNLNIELLSIQNKFQKLHYNILPYIKVNEERIAFKKEYHTLINYYSLSIENINVIVKEINYFNEALLIYNKHGREKFLEKSSINYLSQKKDYNKAEKNIYQLRKTLIEFFKYYNQIKDTLYIALFSS